MKYQVGLSFEKKPTDLLIIDESDVQLFEMPEKFDNFVGENPCVCLTATPGGDDSGLEQRVLGHMGFKILGDYHPSSPLKVDKEINDIMEFIDLQHRPVLIYATEDDGEALQ